MSISKLVKPKSVVIIGASETSSFGRAATLNAFESSIADSVYLVNPNKESVFDRKCYNSISDLPEVPDCAVFCTPRNTILPLMEEAGRFGIQAAVVYASGFSEEHTEEGNALEDKLVDVAKTYDISVLGPNCMGMLNNVDKINFWGGRMSTPPSTETGIAFIAQSGFVLSEIQSRDYISISYALSSGNGNALRLEQLMDFAVDDDDVAVVALYLEGVQDGELFVSALKKAAEKKKPVVVLKSGKSVKGAISAASHTGSMAGSAKTYYAVFEKYGVITADSFDQFMCVAQALAVLKGNLPKVQKYAVVSLSGGESTVSADIAEQVGLELSDISEDTKAKMKENLPGFAVPKNPLDATTVLFNNDEGTIGLLKALQEDEEVGAITVGTNIGLDSGGAAGSLCRSMAHAKNEGITKPLFAVPSFEGDRNLEMRRLMEAGGVPLLSPMETAFPCLKSIGDFGKYDPSKRTLVSCSPAPHDSDETFALSEFDSKAEIAGYGVPIPAQTIVRDKAELAAVCGSMKYPLALKINSSEILHKTDAGGVKLGIKDLSGAESAYEEILENIARTNPNAKTDGILVQEMAPPGIEIIIGISNDKMFGPMLLVGLGGIFVEIFKDVSLYPAPMNKGEAQMMLEKLKGYKLLSGYRGSEPCDISALADLIVTVSNYAFEHRDEIKEMDLNPVLVYPEGVCAVDALIVKYKN